MLQWFNQQRAEGEPVSGPMGAEQAKYYHNALGLEGEFKEPSGWLTRCKNRYSIRELEIQEEKLTAGNEAADTFAEEFKLLTTELYIMRTRPGSTGSVYLNERLRRRTKNKLQVGRDQNSGWQYWCAPTQRERIN